MKTIKILGTGCPSCISTEKIVTEVVNELRMEAAIIKVTEIMDIMAYDVMSTPAIVVDNKVVFKGKVPSKEEVKALLVDNFANNACCSDENIDSSCCSSEEKSTGCC
ncbi:small redox-active disulfide protein 2 [Lutibacter oceani]|uniref:Small redox-active disulfide protein 2 n=1 Tax=Lutibacter oceani TaxID=1853311 RepID=A0A3D9RTU0_9FLAO|nr:thioredoxin family protein [Lutibacter oceani]REE83370.1 small redox-active disulfide protein 2 [Lutibacter oceani]